MGDVVRHEIRRGDGLSVGRHVHYCVLLVEAGTKSFDFAMLFQRSLKVLFGRQWMWS